jgi:hypothetical protein
VRDIAISSDGLWLATLGDLSHAAAFLTGSAIACVRTDLLSPPGTDKTVKIFDVLNFDMTNFLKLDYASHCCCWVRWASWRASGSAPPLTFAFQVHHAGSSQIALAVR